MILEADTNEILEIVVFCKTGRFAGRITNNTTAIHEKLKGLNDEHN
jgi:hypothetical protein